MKKIVCALLLSCPPAFGLKTETITPASAQALGLSRLGSWPRPVEVASGRLWVKFAAGTSPSQKNAILSKIGAKVAREFPALDWTLVSWSSASSVARAMASLRNLSGIVAVDIDRAYHPNKIPDDPLFSSQYALSQIDAPAGWEYETGATSKVTIAMIDTGIDGTAQPDLDGKLLNAGGFKSQFCNPDVSGASCGPDQPPIPACDHATRTAGVAAAAGNNGLDIAGVSWGAQLISLRVFNTSDCSQDCGGLKCGADDAEIVNAINYATSMENTSAAGKVVINMSLGACNTPCLSTDGSTTPTAIANAIALSTAAGIPVVISAGNVSAVCPYTSIQAPANCAGTSPASGVIPVAADDQNNSLAYFSPNGPELAANGVVAPGVDVATTDISSKTASDSGTSFSAPHVAGLAALLLSAHPTASARLVQAWILNGADNIGASANYQGSGRINVFKSLRLAANGASSSSLSTGTLAGYAGQSEAIAFPNPFRPSQAGALSFSIPNFASGSNPTIKIYTVSGQLVDTLNGLTWDGRNAGGQMAASGTYIFLVQTGGGTARGRFSVIR